MYSARCGGGTAEHTLSGHWGFCSEWGLEIGKIKMIKHFEKTFISRKGVLYQRSTWVGCEMAACGGIISDTM